MTVEAIVWDSQGECSEDREEGHCLTTGKAWLLRTGAGRATE